MHHWVMRWESSLLIDQCVCVCVCVLRSKHVNLILVGGGGSELQMGEILQENAICDMSLFGWLGATLRSQRHDQKKLGLSRVNTPIA